MFNEKSFNLPSPPAENLVISMTFIIILREKKKKIQESLLITKVWN